MPALTLSLICAAALGTPELRAVPAHSWFQIVQIGEQLADM